MNDNNECTTKGIDNKTWLIIGCAAGGVVLIVIIVVVVVVVVKKSK